MCGIAGLCNFGPRARDNMERMKQRMIRRGPDDGGTWLSEDGTVCLGHRRLSIMDLSMAGHQPMVSHSGRSVMVYNGEIYDYQRLRRRLIEDGICTSFRSTCDTEVLLEGIEAYGMEKTLDMVKGMFAIAVYDQQEHTLTLSRDRIGEKPLYYGFVASEDPAALPFASDAFDVDGMRRRAESSSDGGAGIWTSLRQSNSAAPSAGFGEGRDSRGSGESSGLNAAGRRTDAQEEKFWLDHAAFAFASDLGCFRALEGFRNRINTGVLDIYFTHGYIPAPYTIYQGIYKLLPGTILTIQAPFGQNQVSSHAYWSIREVAVKGQKPENQFRGSRQEAADELEHLLRQAIRGQMVADVPLGAFLSAGIDSSTIVALMQAESTNKVRSFTIGMEEKGYNEATYAKEIARHLGTDHTELYITEQDARNVVPLLPQMFSEPFADSSQIPTYLVSRMTRQHVTVSLSGDAGDELFAGYTDYGSVSRIWGKLQHVPKPLRRPASSFVLHSPLAKKDIYRIKGKLLGASSPEDIYRLSYETDPLTFRIALDHPGLPYAYTEVGVDETGEVAHDVMLMDMRMYHPDDILVKVDRTAMAVSLETRVPMLDKDVVEFAWTLPIQLLRDGDTGKQVLRDVLYRYVPKEMMDRPKKGFSIPIEKWLREPELRAWAEDLLDRRKLREQGILDPEVVSWIWKDFIDNGHWRIQIWYILMFQAWYEGEYRQAC